MNDPVASTLQDLLDEHGHALLGQHRRVEALLRDLHPDRPRTVAITVEALDRGVVGTLQQANTCSATEFDALTARLREQSGLSQRFALQAVEIWMQALRVQRLSRATDRPSPLDSPSAVNDRPGTLEAQITAALTSDSSPPHSRRSR